MKLAVVSVLAVVGSSCDYYNRLENNQCADDCLGSTVGICPIALVTKLGGLNDGTCASLNYTIAAGSTSQKAGPCGTLTFKLYNCTPGTICKT